MVEEISPLVAQAIEALNAFGMTGRSPLDIRRVLAMWPDSSKLTVDESDRVVMRFIVRCQACNWPVERVPDPTGDYWRHAYIPDEMHAAEVASAGARRDVPGQPLAVDPTTRGARA